MPCTGTALCHPQNWLCRSERKPALDTQAPNSPLVHINGDNAYSPPDTRRETHGDIQVQFLQLRHVFRQKCKSSIPHVRQHTLPSQHLMTPFRLNTKQA